MAHKSDSDELSALRAENARFISLIEAHGIEWRLKQQIPVRKSSILSTDDKVALLATVPGAGRRMGSTMGK
ncbi:hypothetical protein J4727_15645 [Providencia rettgeri]|uniref:Uncharacterized protein n=1 Tax=Providencia rettgeri TaxID=587 RepID=A0A939NGR9_PRORE|nr:hypothetical protein [Providencia rettgeri]